VNQRTAPSTPATWYATEEAFRTVLKDARLQARTEWDQNFVQDQELRFKQHGMAMQISDRQLTQLCRIADAYVPLRRSTVPITRTPHNLYSDGDQGVPEQIYDSNGSVVLGLCKVCGQAEAELEPYCPGKRA
jgi:hypothetical protein